MIEVDVPSASKIEPRMSVLLKGSRKKFVSATDLSVSGHSSSSRELVHAEHSDAFAKGACNTMRSPLSASSILMTGTFSSILRTSSVERDILRRTEKKRIQSNGIQFSEAVHVRNHIHASDLTDNEKLNAWFRKPEYKAIFKNNTQIISIVEKREREAKRKLAKKQREMRKRRNRKYLSKYIQEEPVPEVCEDQLPEEGVNDMQQAIIGINRDDERGFSARGLENETAKKRRSRDQIYLQAKFAVLSVQEDVDEHMYSMQEKHDEKLATIARGITRKNSKRRFSFNRQEDEQTEENDTIMKMTEIAKQEFAIYAKAQYKNMIRTISKRYGDICLKDAKSAHERGMKDEQAVRAIDWIESEGDNSHVSNISSLKEVSECSQENDKRRPSATSTAPTEASAASLGSFGAANEGIRLSRMNRAKLFLWKFV